MFKVFKKALAVLIAAALLSATSCGGTKTITIGIESNSLPVCGKNTDGEPDGFIVEMAREAGKRMGMEINFKYVDMADKSKNFSSVGVDAFWGKIVPNEQNRKTMLFTDCYFTDSEVLVVESSSEYEKKSDLAGKVVGAVKGSAAESALAASDLSSTIATGKPVEYNELVTAFLALDNSEVDALAVDESYARYLMTEHAEQYRILGEKLSQADYAVAVNRNDSNLRDAFNRALREMKNHGTSKNISIKWFGVDMTE